MVLNQKRYTAQATVTGTAATAAAIGAIPFNFADSLILVPLETGLTKAIYKIYGVSVSSDLIKGIVGSTVITAVAKSIIQAIPVIGPAINAAVAGALVLALGEAVTASAEAMYKGALDPEQIDKVVEYIAEKIKSNEVFDKILKLIQENMDKIDGKSGKEIFAALMESNKR